jgi:hypothetical protein
MKQFFELKLEGVEMIFFGYTGEGGGQGHYYVFIKRWYFKMSQIVTRWGGGGGG